MRTFYEWLKTQPLPQRMHSVQVASQMIKGSIDLPLKIEAEPVMVTAKETARIMRMEAYVNEFLEVDDANFNKMLQDRHVHSYQKLAAEYLPVDGGIASDLREHGWPAIARYIAYVRNREKMASDVLNLPRPNKLKTCLIQVKEYIKDRMTQER